uniref:Uncharacterized protein n=1 Tax=Chaetoceros debilis TaxID=122233 RepID=A0A6S8SC59_9STRA|mmetsp:Transcript_22538/g.34370  ORF Transcript_22538/g.34370 Transcript_22538/m.34370 type:complete len:204 (-) Transcript_22538:111-722(-)
MSASSILQAVLILIGLLHIQSFSVQLNGLRRNISFRHSVSSLSHSSSQFKSSSESALSMSNDDDDDNEKRPILVDQTLFKSAISTVEQASGMPLSTEDRTLSYAIGRVKITLPTQPGIDLVETPGLVLVNGVTQAAIDAGVQTLDTLVRVSSQDGIISENTMGKDIDAQFQVISAAIARAREMGHSGFEVEVNRLLKGYYKME